MPFNKEDNMVLKAEARYNPLFDSGIVFYNLDTNNRLGFQMTRKGVIVPLSEVNVQSYLSLIAEDGSNIVDNLVFENELQGVLSYRIPAEFLKHVGNVHAEVHLTTNGKDDTVVMGEFDFEIKDASINKIPADLKIGYIRMFDDLKKTIEQKVADIEEAIADGEDYVTAIQNASADAKQTINSTVATAKADIDTKVNTATTNLNKTATDATKAITDTAKSATDSVDAAMDEFHNDLANNNFLKMSDTTNWQKFPNTDLNGMPLVNTLTDWNDILSLNTTRTAIDTNIASLNAPPNSGGRYYDVDIYRRTKTTGHVVATEMVQGKMFLRVCAGRVGSEAWRDWVELETTAGSAQKVATLKDLLLDLAPSTENGGVKMSVSATQDVLEQYVAMKSGTFGVYVAAGAANGHPSGRASRGIAMKSAANIGLLILVDTAGKIASNYLNQTSWSGWQMAGQTLLWSGNAVAKKGTVFTLSQSKENFIDLKLLVSINTVGDDICWMNARGTNNASLRSSNAFDDASGDMLYEITLEKTSATKLTVINEARINHSTNNGLVNNNDWTIKEIWGMN